jgi:peptide/nickel transport system permease protein
MTRLCVWLVSALLMCAFLAPWIAPYDPTALDVGPALAPPSVAHPMGTDQLGRDVWSRWLFGARSSLSLGVGVTALAAAIGTVLGAVAGAAGGGVDRAFVVVVDLWLSLPRLVVCLAAVGLVRARGGAELWVLGLVLAATSWMGLARTVRAEVKRLVGRDFVLAAVSSGAPWSRVLWVHVAPHVRPYVVAFSVLALGQTILTEAALSYLGLGIAPPTPSWGAAVAEGTAHLRDAPWLTAWPAAGIVCAGVAFGLLADGWARRDR